MPAEALIETHIGETVRLKAAAAFATAGLTIDEAIHRLLLRAADQQIVPLELYTQMPKLWPLWKSATAVAKASTA
jgi:antitoxin component of RelBE/YafQ-DinJ toxin-antitoxin module